MRKAFAETQSHARSKSGKLKALQLLTKAGRTNRYFH